MVPFLYTAREHHGVPTAAALRQRHAQALGRKRRAGMQFQVHNDPQPVLAFVSGGSWVVVCPSCSSGCATDPAWQLACCFGCGAVFQAVVFPDDRAAIEAALLERVAVATRNWQPGETEAQLRAEHEAFGGKRR